MKNLFGILFLLAGIAYADVLYTQGQILAKGTLPASKTAIYTVPTNNKAQVMFMSIFQSGATAPQTIGLWITPSGGSDYQIGQWILSSQSYSAYPIQFPILLNSGDAIKAQTTNASQVTYVLSGANHI